LAGLDALPFVSIIVPCKRVDEYTLECVERCLQLDYEGGFEVLVVPDEFEGELRGARVIPSGPLPPGAKRNLAMRMARGDVFAFIDSDAYPRPDWLRNAVRRLAEADAVGGPALTPPSDSFAQRAGGCVLSSPLMGDLSARFRGSPRVAEADLLHSVNCVVRRGVIESVGGWDERHWPGEDTLLCARLRAAGRRLLHAGDVVVYHHRRPLFAAHARQVGAYGRYRGFLARRYGDGLVRPIYFAPAALLIYLAAGAAASALWRAFLPIYAASLIAYALALLAGSAMACRWSGDLGGADPGARGFPRAVKLLLFVAAGTLMTHMVYGAEEIVGALRGVGR
jgi:glycosyltransferase involved in cell wall biosynthesis